MNNTVTFDDSSYGFQRRFKIIPFNADMVNSPNRKIDMAKILCTPENLQYICSKAMYQLHNIIKTGKFTIPKIVEETTDDYMLEENPVKRFITEANIRKYEVGETRAEYNAWAKERGYPILSKKKFGEEMHSLKFRTVKGSTGDREYYYVAHDYSEEEQEFENRMTELDRIITANTQEELDALTFNTPNIPDDIEWPELII